MASTYVNNLRLEEIGSGEQSGTWGDTTNTNLELIGQAVAWGTRAIANASTDNITIADGAADADRCLGLKLTGGGQACTVTLLPNTSSKTWFMYNATSYDLTFTCGSGANVIIPAGHTKVIATDGLGSGGVVHDLLTDLNVASNLFVKNPGTGDNSTANIYLQTAEADIAANDVIGKINFQAPNEGTGTDAILVSAAIQAISEGDFSSTSNATSLNFMTGASEAATTKMTLSSGGNLTVTGDVNVGANLDVTGNAVIDGTALVTDVLTTTAATVFNGGFAANQESTIIAADGAADNAFALIVKNQEATDGRSQGVRIDAGSNASDAALVINDHDASTSLFRVKGSGVVEFVDGTASLPSITNFGDLNTGMFFPAADTIAFAEGGAEAVRITSDGQVLIGATASQSVTLSNGNALQIQGLSSNTSGISTTRHSNDSGGPYFNFGKSRGTADGAVTVVQANDILGQIFFSGADGTDILTPAASIQAFVDGTPSGNDMPGRLVFSTTADGADAATERFRISSDGSLSTLTLGTSNVRFGVNAGNSIASGGNYNVFLGDEAGTANTIGDENVAVGYNALAANISGDRSTAVGYQALVAQKNADNSTYDANNTAIGFNAMVAMTSGLRNVAIGSGALDLEDTGSRSVAIGFSALSDQNADTSNYNVAVGYDAGAKVSLGVQNTIVGAQAGDLLDEADRNVVIGYQALTADHKGDRTVAIGAFALAGQDFTSVTSTNNVAVGYEAGGGLTTGASSTLIGSNAGVYISTANNSTFMGFKAGQGVAAGTGAGVLTGDNNVAIGKNAGLLLQGAATNNTFVGTEAGDSITTVAGNTAVGYQSLSAAAGASNTALGIQTGLALTGTENVLIGNVAGTNFTDADQNVAIGSGALLNDVKGDGSVAVGTSALQSQAFSSVTTTGNTALGHKAGKFISDGQSNTFIGFEAGEGVSGTGTTGDLNTCVGKAAGAIIQGAGHENTCLGASTGASLTTGSNNVYIGSSSRGSAADIIAEFVIGYNQVGRGAGTVAFGNSGAFSSITVGQTSIAGSSDERLKNNITSSTAGLSFIKDLRPVTYEWKNKGDIPSVSDGYVEGSTEKYNNTNKVFHGFVAQEVKTVIDNHSEIKSGHSLWKEGPDTIQELAPSALMPMLTKAVQELSTALDAALARIATLEG